MFHRDNLERGFITNILNRFSDIHRDNGAIYVSWGHILKSEPTKYF